MQELLDVNNDVGWAIGKESESHSQVDSELIWEGAMKRLTNGRFQFTWQLYVTSGNSCDDREMYSQ